MNPVILLRSTSIVSLLFAAAHTTGGLKFWSPMGENDVLRAMRSVHFDIEGVSRSYLDFYLGFGLVLAVYLFMQAIVLWQLASLTKPEPRRVRPLIGTVFCVSVASGFLCWRYILPVPSLFCLVIAVLLVFAFYAARGSTDP